ncbi:MAG: hypothetical protein U0S36_13210 [Candidatus Nanopelagicales bacterium]
MPTTLLAAVEPATVGAEEILLTAGLIAVAMLAAVTSYRGMQRPRLVLTEESEGTFRAARGDVVRYALAAPFLILGWNLLLIVILIIAANSLTGDAIVVVSSAIVLAARAFAHVSPERSHELAKTVPLTLVTLVLISGGIRDQASLEEIADEIGALSITPQATVLLLVAEYLVTLAWYWLGVRWLWPRGKDVPGLPRHSVRDDHLRRTGDETDTFTFDSHRS